MARPRLGPRRFGHLVGLAVSLDCTATNCGCPVPGWGRPSRTGRRNSASAPRCLPVSAIRLSSPRLGPRLTARSVCVFLQVFGVLLTFFVVLFSFSGWPAWRRHRLARGSLRARRACTPAHGREPDGRCRYRTAHTPQTRFAVCTLRRLLDGGAGATHSASLLKQWGGAFPAGENTLASGTRPPIRLPADHRARPPTHSASSVA